MLLCFTRMIQLKKEQVRNERGRGGKGERERKEQVNEG